jgi:hypothetical protein
VHPNDRVRMSKAEAHELKLLHMIRQPTPGELA